MPSAIRHFHYCLLSAEVRIIVGLRGGSIVQFGFVGLEFLELLDFYTLAVLVPLRVDELHEAIEAAEFRQELCLVQVPLTRIHIGLNARLFIEAPICVILSLINGFAEPVVDLDPFFDLFRHHFLLLLVGHRH